MRDRRRRERKHEKSDEKREVKRKGSGNKIKSETHEKVQGIKMTQENE